MGSKAESKALMERSGVPLVPGYHGEAQDLPVLKEAAERIGYPVLIKASAGGGGKGMRIVESASEIEAAIEGAKREALASFGDDRVLVEKYLTRPRHIEIQVFADTHGNTVSLFERDARSSGATRRYSRAPAPGMDPARRKAVGGRRRRGARRGLRRRRHGGVHRRGQRLLLHGNEYRLQVEHPVTEMVTGLTGGWQLRVAAGELPMAEVASACGHAIRRVRRDPARDFLPAVGTLAHLHQPRECRAGCAWTPGSCRATRSPELRPDDRL
jgi:3-methylcrotonyl-CoA carboxylase alpha subunit